MRTCVSVLLDSIKDCSFIRIQWQRLIYTDIMLIYTSTVAMYTYIKLSCCMTLKEIVLYNLNIRGFPDGSAIKNPPAVQETQESQVWSLAREDPLLEEMSTHSSVITWRIPWTEEPGRLQSIGSQRVGHYWSNLEHIHKWNLGEGFMFRAPGKISLPGYQYPEVRPR